MKITKKPDLRKDHKKKNASLAVPKAIARKTGFNKNAVPPKATNGYTKDNPPPVLTVKEKLERVEFLYELMLKNIDKVDICDLFCEKYGLKPAGFEPRRRKTRDQMESDFALTREDHVKYYVSKAKKNIERCEINNDMRSLGPLLKDYGEKLAKLGDDDSKKTTVNVSFSLADLHNAIENPTTDTGGK